ncbi:hypothetical protein [Franconibacter helveticus]|uniref:hypothetical protein n=1 Tax=Franconibacter helveticus TaxID=357240 RepID=UPI00066BAE0A|nr:hypothetical protein [Franconibacter helveticus]
MNIGNARYCYPILAGQFGGYRQSDHRMLPIVSYLAILGLGGLPTDNTFTYLKALTPGMVGRISQGRLHDRGSNHHPAKGMLNGMSG